MDRMHTTLSAPSRETACSTAVVSVRSWCPSSLPGITTSSMPAAATHLTQVFWSIRGQTTYLAAAGRAAFRASRLIVSAIPVASGSTRTDPRSR